MHQVGWRRSGSGKRKDGTFGYTAQIRIMGGGAQVYQEAQTFDRQCMGPAPVKDREAAPLVVFCQFWKEIKALLLIWLTLHGA